MSSLCQYIAFTANDFQSWWRPSFWEASQKVKPIRWKHSTTGHDLGLTVRGNAGEVKNKKPQRWQHLLLGAEGRPNTASRWGAMESWLWAGSPLLLHRWGAGLAHIPHRALKTGTPSGVRKAPSCSRNPRNTGLFFGLQFEAHTCLWTQRCIFCAVTNWRNCAAYQF